MYAALFPGQGSHRPGMGRELYEAEPVARETFERVSEAVGRNVADICFDLDEEALRQTQNAQLALYTCGIAAYRAFEARLPSSRPVAMAGHSVGEYAALASAGYFSIDGGARLVCRRGKLMASAGSTRPGTMAAVLGLDRTELEAVCSDVAGSGQVVVANDNCPGQMVISGDLDAVAAASALAAERGARRVLPLSVSGAFHSPLMAEAAREMRAALEATEFSASEIPVVSNVTAAPETDPAKWPDLLARQLESPVRWTEVVRRLRAEGASEFVECGVGDVLVGLLKRIDREAVGFSIQDPESLAAAAATLSPVGAGK